MVDSLADIGQRGFYTVPGLLDRAACDSLRAELYQQAPGLNGSFFASGYDPDPGYRENISSIIARAVFEPVLRPMLPGYELFYANLLHKVKGDYSECVLHTDWSITDETKYQPLHAWIPLVDVSVENGTLGVVAGSHRVTHPYRGCQVPQYYERYYPELKRDRLFHFDVAAGTAVFYHPGLIHYSPPNLTDEVRPAVLLSFCPRGSEALLYYRSRLDIFGGIRVYPLSRDFYTHWNKKDRPRLPLLRRVHNPRHERTLKEFLEKLEA